MDSKGRRETWDEAVDRYFDFFQSKFGDKVPAKVFAKTKKNVREMKAMPSMRAFWSAGPALERTHAANYNCAYLPINDLRSFSEMLYLLCCGTGVGFSVEREYISQLPTIAQQHGDGAGVYVVEDNKEGWAESLLVGLTNWFGGKDIEFDYSRIRPRGARLKTFGGRASGPDPLKDLHRFARERILSNQGNQLSSLEVLDICNKIAEIVVVGGVRRSSQISFSDLDDADIRHAKDFSKGPVPVSRHMSNNSAVYRGRPSMQEFLTEWTSLIQSGSGERGIFNLNSSTITAPRRQFSEHMRSNPCNEICLRPYQMCNLSEVVVRATDTFATLTDKAKSAVWLGAMQSCLTDFPFLRPEWEQNCREERLMGVSLTGQMDNPALMSEERLSDLKQIVIEETQKAAKALGINLSVAITTVKPSGTVSQLVDSASGAHPRFSPYYIRRVRVAATDPLCQMMKAQGVPMSPENGQGPQSVAIKRQELVQKGYTDEQAGILVPDWTPESVQTWVVSFPVKTPQNAITKEMVTAIDQLKWYLKMKKYWCEHNVSITIYVKDDEWLSVGDWVYKHFDEISGVSFLPFDGGKYEQAPYEEISEAQYARMVKEFVHIDYSQLAQFEEDDNTTGAQSLACSGGSCELL
jgi:ribonucleoside-diphosphate reductase alpha chain